jgi:MFS family permease
VQEEHFSALLTGAATIGLAVGSLFGGNMIRNGRHRALVIGNCAAVLGSLMSIYA